MEPKETITLKSGEVVNRDSGFPEMNLPPAESNPNEPVNNNAGNSPIINNPATNNNPTTTNDSSSPIPNTPSNTPSNTPTNNNVLTQDQIDQLNIAAGRIRDGNAGEQDQANIDFATENYGYVVPKQEETSENNTPENNTPENNTITLPSGEVVDKDSGFPDTSTEEIPETFDVQIQSMVDKMDEIYNTWLSDFEAIQNGTFALTEQEQGLLDSIETSLVNAKNSQIEANKNYEAMMAQSGISGGRNRYAPEIEAGNIKNSVDVGIAKISELDSKALQSKYELEQLIKDNNLTQITAKYEQMQGYLKEKAQTLIDTEEIIKNFEIDQQKLKNEAQKDALDYHKELIISGYTPIT